MALLDIVIAPDPRLKQVSTDVERVSDDVLRLLDDMLETMYDAPGIGLAAIQVGVPKRLIVMDLAGREEDPNPLFLINPVISDTSAEVATYEEGCLSIPEQYADVQRPARCTVTYLDRDGNAQVMKAEGLLATCVQHEMDHLNGILFIDHLSALRRKMVIKRVQKLTRQKLKDAC